MKKSLFFACFLFLALAAVQAYDTTPLQISLWPSRFQIAPEEMSIAGLKLNLPYGANQKIAGLDLGFASSSQNTGALQLNLIMNRTHQEFSGMQVGIFNQSGNASGIIIGGFNVTDDRTSGVQVGILNSTMKMRGVQIGLINYCESMVGAQIGIANIITESVVCFFPIINFCF